MPTRRYHLTDHWSRNRTGLGAELRLQMKRYGDDAKSLRGAYEADGFNLCRDALRWWIEGKGAPRSRKGYLLLEWISKRYGLPADHFKKKLLGDGTEPISRLLAKACSRQGAAIRWHLPHDFRERSIKEQAVIADWIERNVLPLATDYGKYVSRTRTLQYALRFPPISAEPNSPLLNAPERLTQEVLDLVHFKTTPLSPTGFGRYATWNENSARVAVKAYGLLFGALSSDPNSVIAGLGVPRDDLTIGLFVFPTVWDWYFQWLCRRRGFYSFADARQLYELASLTRPETGWLRQHCELAERLVPIEGLVSEQDVLKAKTNWIDACGAARDFAKVRLRDIHRVALPHRDTYQSIMPVLNSAAPLKVYRKVADEILRLMPDRKTAPLRAAEAMRGYLMVRFLLHAGLRQRNLRTLLISLPGDRPRSERKLEQLKCGELRWLVSENVWEIFIPAVGFKNPRSTFFGGNPFRLVLPNFDGLYDAIQQYLDVDRPRLLGKTKDPHTFFIASRRRKQDRAAYTTSGFYIEYVTLTQRYGIYNPFTRRGAIEGLLPHGPHSVRDVLATHVLKQTGSYDLAAYAIQDATVTVKRHYGRFEPKDKSALAAAILNLQWEADPAGETNLPVPVYDREPGWQVRKPRPMLKNPR